MKYAIRVLLVVFCGLLAAEPTGNVAKAVVTASGHYCARCNYNLPEAVTQASPGASKIVVEETRVTFKPGSDTDWGLLKKRFDDKDRPITGIELYDNNGRLMRKFK